MLVDAIVRKNLDIYRGRYTMSSTPIEGWEYKFMMYREKEDYEELTDWAPYTYENNFFTLKTCMMRTVFTPKRPAANEEAFLELRVPGGCEAFVVINGEAYVGVDNDANRNRVYLRDDMFDRELKIEMEIYSCRFADAPRTLTPLEVASYCVVDKMLEEFSYYMDFLSQARRFAKNDYTREKLNFLFENAIRETDAALEGAEYRANIADVFERLQKKVEALNIENDDGIIDCVASTHIDVAWLWQYKDTVRKSGRSALNQLRLMDRYPEFQFSLSQPSVYNYIKEVYPETFEQIKQKVKEGQWRLVGPMWVEGDLNISGAETLVREFVYGHAFFEKEFGKSSDVCWIPDSFGFPASLPQIFAKCGMKSFFTTKVRWQAADRFPYNVFVWEGIDKSQLVSTVPDMRSYYNNSIEFHDVDYASNHIQQKGIWDHGLMSYGWGDGGGGPTESMLKNYRLYEKVPGLPKLRITKAEDYFEELGQKRDLLPVWKGELCVETHQGTYTTVAMVKRCNRYIEMAFRRLELLAVLMNAQGKDPDYAEIVKNWKDVLLLQFHDVLPGSSIDPVYDDAKFMYANLFDFAGKKQSELVEKALTLSCTDKVSVYNPNSFTGTAYVSVDSKYAGYAFTDGKETANVISDGKGGFCFMVKDLAGFEARTYTKTAAVSAKAAITAKVNGDTISVENSFFTFDITAEGTLVNFYDKRADRIVSEEGKALNNFVAYKDGPEYEDAWNIDKDYKQRPCNLVWENKVELVEANGERVVVKSTKTHKETVITQYIIAYADIARVDFDSHINWQEKYKILQVSFPVNVTAPQASYEIAYGLTKRTTHANTPGERWKHEFAAHRYTDLSDEKYGVALLNDCKYGHNVIDNDMIMTLFRNTDYPSKFYDTGDHDFAYSFLPHVGGLIDGKVAEEGYLFNSPFVVFEGATEAAPLMTLSNNGMIVDCIKPAEDGNGYIIRAYEPYGVPGKVDVKLSKSATVTEETPIEKKICDVVVGDSFTINYKPFEFRTFRIV